MGKKEEEEVIRIAKKLDKLAQKKNAVSRSVMNESPTQRPGAEKLTLSLVGSRRVIPNGLLVDM